MVSDHAVHSPVSRRAKWWTIRLTYVKHPRPTGEHSMRRLLAFTLALILAAPFTLAQPKENAAAKAEHDMIGAAKEEARSHTMHPDAQWYPDAGFGLFIHWGISSVKAMNISWPMIPGRALAAKKIDDPAERERIIREGDWNLNGKPNSITPNEYWAMAKDFNPQNYDPDKWL